MLQPQAVVRNALTTGRESVTVFLTDVGHGLLDVSHSMLAMVGLAVVAGALFMGSQDEMRDSLEARAWGWPPGAQRRRRPRGRGRDRTDVHRRGQHVVDGRSGRPDPGPGQRGPLDR